MKAFVCTDIEGVAGVVSAPSQTFPDGKYFEAAKHLLTAEINAAVDGMVQSGVDEILVLDGHGPGAIVYEELHPAATLIHGRPLAPFSVLEPEIARCDVGLMLGQHAMAGVADGNLSHTQSSMSIFAYTLNGQPIGEIAQFALYLGAIGLPVIFLSGDDAACREAEALVPGITATSVKKGLTRHSAMSVAASVAQQRITDGVVRAFVRHRRQPVAPLVWPGPFVLEKQYFQTETADSAAQRPGTERVDSRTVRLRSDDIKSLIYA